MVKEIIPFNSKEGKLLWRCNKKGYLILPDYNYEQVFIELHHKPWISRELLGSDSKCSMSIIPSRSKDNREYMLRRRIPSNDMAWESAYDLFEKLEFGDYKFEIRAIDYCSAGGHYVGLFVPDFSLLEKGLNQAISDAAAHLNKDANNDILRHGDIEKMVSYAMKDLKDRKITERNRAAGMEADMVVGLD